ncbi:MULTISPECIES: CE1759 family FMN reductase [unclassified Corynebacterium]|uniref:CE1759 family FMN reductase n=1 Tax=unclassified Corynebacterium TaxID=2624378 RepID=UPI0029CA649D|nr:MULTISPECIES: CE1759 family FMN reductase [unclassified Corynebacterium]WPF67344.1 NAD(P)H-dependent oxidoreductase [Corynebacterium sp. 22KM0430]WPF69833.1 NAD(P)H-dependent oxidoreductase [Corynebacterium sp. 21KM1197]
MKKLVVVQSGLSVPSSTKVIAEQIAGSVKAQVSKRGEGLDVEFVDVKDYLNDLASFMSTGIPGRKLNSVQEKISSADALVAATPVFTASYSGVFKLFFDSFGTDSLNGMPMIIAATAGTPRHSLVLDYAMRPLFTYLRAVVMPTGIFAATDDFGSEEGVASRISRAASELSEYIVSTEKGSVVGFGPDFLSNDGIEKGKRRNPGTRVEMGSSFADLLKGHDGNL